jgi:hypothetical protein
VRPLIVVTARRSPAERDRDGAHRG